MKSSARIKVYSISFAVILAAGIIGLALQPVPERVGAYAEKQRLEGQLRRVVSCSNKDLTYSAVVGTGYGDTGLRLYALVLPTPTAQLSENNTLKYRSTFDALGQMAKCALQMSEWNKLTILVLSVSQTFTVDDGKTHWAGKLLYGVQFVDRAAAETLVSDSSSVDMLVGDDRILVYSISNFMFDVPVSSPNIVDPELFKLSFERYQQWGKELNELRNQK